MIKQADSIFKNIPPDVLSRIWEGAKWTAYQPLRLLQTETPKALYPLYGAAAMSPILAYQIHSHLKKNKDLSNLDQDESAIKTAEEEMNKVLGPDNRSELVDGLDSIKALMQQAKMRASTRGKQEVPVTSDESK